MNKKKAILFIAGVGGHQAQIKRIFEGLKSTLTTKENIEILYLTELGGWVENSSINIIEVPDLRNKHSKIKNIFSTPYAMFKQLQIIFKLLNIYDIKICISTGPGLCIIPSFILNLKRSSIIYIETWSRFENLSLTGIVMKNLANIFIVQNIELLNKTKKGIYGGRL